DRATTLFTKVERYPSLGERRRGKHSFQGGRQGWKQDRGCLPGGKYLHFAGLQRDADRPRGFSGFSRDEVVPPHRPGASLPRKREVVGVQEPAFAGKRSTQVKVHGHPRRKWHWVRLQADSALLNEVEHHKTQVVGFFSHLSGHQPVAVKPERLHGGGG